MHISIVHKVVYIFFLKDWDEFGSLMSPGLKTCWLQENFCEEQKFCLRISVVDPYLVGFETFWNIGSGPDFFGKKI